MPIFISYSRKDTKFIDKLIVNLIKDDVYIWIDKLEMRVGDSLIEKIQTAVSESSAIVVALSKSYVNSEWCKKELSAGLIRELEEKHVIVFPIIIEECSVPLFLRDKYYADFRNSFQIGYQSLFLSLKQQTSLLLGKKDNTDYIVDWAIDLGTSNDLFFMDIYSISFSKQKDHSVLCVIQIKGNEKVTKRYKLYKEANLESYYQFAILEMLNEKMNHTNSKVGIFDNKPITKRLGFADPDGYDLELYMNCRRLGVDTGYDLLFDYSKPINYTWITIKNSLRKLTEEESNKLSKILRTL